MYSCLRVRVCVLLHHVQPIAWPPAYPQRLAGQPQQWLQPTSPYATLAINSADQTTDLTSTGSFSTRQQPSVQLGLHQAAITTCGANREAAAVHESSTTPAATAHARRSQRDSQPLDCNLLRKSATVKHTPLVASQTLASVDFHDKGGQSQQATPGGVHDCEGFPGL